MAEITVDVGVRLKAMQSSVADLQKVLDGLQPNSSGFKALQRIIADINRDIDRLRIQTSKPFGSQNQFNQTEKTVDKLEESLEKVKITIDRIKFSDLKLDSSQTAQLDNFKKQLKDIKQEFTDFKADLKGQFLDNDFNKAFVEGINPNLLNKSFDEIVKNVENRVNSLGSTLAKAKAELEEFKNASKLGERISKASQTTNGVVSPEVMGQEMFDKFFQTNSKGVFSFKTGGGLKKGEIQQQFLEYLASEFQLTQSQIDQLKNQTASNIRKILAQEDFFNPQKGAAETANKKMDGAESAFTAASKSYENAAAVVARLTPLLSALSNEELSLEDKQKLVNQAIRQFEQDCVNGAKGSKTLQDSTKGLSSGLESFKQQLGQVNAQWLNLQKQQATFNSMKSAIVNFMGFNQVLNLTKKAVKEAMDHIKQLDTVMNGIAIVTDMTTADLWNQVDVYSEMAQRYGTSIQGAYEVSKIYYQAGYETNEVLTLMNETLKLSKISGLDYATTTDYMMTATRGFHMEVSEASKVVDVYSALAANTAVSQQELAEAMTRTASSMESVGTTFEEASAMIATMVATTRESANNIGSAMKSIASRYGELTKDPAKLMDAEGEAMSFNKVDTALKSVGISLQTTDHQFRSFTDVILELSEVWDTLDSVQQRYIATQFAGNRQQSRFLALVSNPDQIKENLEVAESSEDTGTLQALKALDSLETKLNQVQVAYQQFYTTIGVEEVWKTFLDGTKNVIDTLNNLPKLFGKAPLGAVAVIYDIISLIKNVALKGLEEIASIWIQKTQEMTAQTQSESGKNRDNGTAWVDNFVSGISGGIDKIRQIAKEAVDAANEEAYKKSQEQKNQATSAENNYYSGLRSAVERFDAAISPDEELDASIALAKYGLSIEDARVKLEAYTNTAQKTSVVTEEAGQVALSGGQRFLVGAQGIAKAALSSKKLASTTSGLAMGLNTIAMLINTTSESGKRLAGTLMTVAGGLRAVGAVLQYVGSAGQMAFPWMAVITGVIGIVNGISTAVETAQEKIERLEKEAEELNNEAKQAKAEYNTLQRSVDKLDELKEKRYESAEAAEEYQSAVDDLASKFPEMIAGFDEAGNIILDTTDAERILAEAREKSKQATYDAAKAEMDAAKEKLNEEKEGLTNLQLGLGENNSFNVGEKRYVDFFTDEEGNLTESSLLGDFGYKKSHGLPNSSLEEGISFETFKDELYDLASKYSEDQASIWYFLWDYIDQEKETLTNIETLKSELQNKIQSNDEGAQKYQELLNLLTDNTALETQSTEIENLLKQIKEPDFDLVANTEQLTSLSLKLEEILKDTNLDENAKAYYENLQTQLKPIIDKVKNIFTLNEAYKGNERIVISAWQQANDNNGKAWEYLEESSGLAAIVTKQIQSDIGDIDYTTAEVEQASKWKEYQAAAEQFYSSLSETDQKIFNQMIEDTANYSGIDIAKYFKIAEGTDLYNAIINYYSDGVKSIQARLKNNLTAHHDVDFSSLKETDIDFISNYAKLISDENNEFTKNEESFLNSILSQFDFLNKQGFVKRAEVIGLAGINLFEEIQTLPEDIQKSLINSILENGLTTKEGIQKTLDSFKNDKTVTNTQVDEILTDISFQIINNVALGIQTATSNLLENWDDTSKELTKALSGGLEFKEAETLITKAESLGVSLDLDTDFVQNGDKLILTSEKFNEYWEKLNGQSEKNAEEWQADIDAAQAVIDTRRNSIGKIRALSEEDKAAILAIDKNFDFDTYTTNGKLNTAGIIALQKAIQESSEGLERYNTYAEMAAQQLKQTQEWILGDYSSLSLSPEALKELSSGKTILKREDYNLRAARDNINSAYNSLISDVLSKGFDKINLEDYSGLINAGEGIDLANTSYEDFVREYAIWAGKSIEETNSLIIQAIEKDTQTTTGAAAEAVGKIQWLSDKKGFASLGDIQSLADALGISVDKILGEYNNQLDMYLVDLSNVEGIDLSAIDGFSDTVKDSINAFLKQIFENVNKAITGKLTNADVTTLTGQLKQLGLENLTLDFTETVDGLKLSQRSAIELYNELKKIDSLQAQLVFEDLAKSLEVSDTNYTNISTTLARIAELEKAIKEMKPDDARLQMYKNELAVAQEIARTRSSTDNKDFNFMDRALPTGMQNPIDYWNATGEAYKAMNASAKSGYMEIQDFYNIVQEMSNMAQVSGQTLHFMGQEIDGSAEAAASLIQRGFSALTNVKGDGVKIALGNIGADFKTGAADMKGDFDSGIKEMAKAQIQMLDAAINMLEAIVAMENIDTSGDGILDLDELFIGGDATNGWTAQTETWFNRFETLSGGIEVGGVDLKTALLNMAQSGEDGAERVKQFMNDLKNIDWTLGDVNVAEKVHQLVQGLFVGQEITQGTSVFEVLKVPKNAEKTTDEFKNWVKETGLAAEEADTLIRILQNGYNISETGSDGKRNKYAEAVEKLLGLEKENQKTKFEEFTKGEKITQEEIELFSKLDINWDENGNITNATYTASDGSKLPLDKNNPSIWQDAIAEYERKITIGQHTGQTTDKITDNSKLESIVLKSGLTVQGVISATSGGYTASYNGVTSPTFKSEDEARQWLYDLVNEKDKEKRSGGAYNPELVTDEVTGETKIKYNYHYILEPGTNKEDLIEPAKGVKQLDFKKDVLPKILKTGEKGEDGNFTYSLDDIGLTGMKITSKPGEIEQVLNDSLNDIIGETDPFAGLPEKIAEGITTAFTQDTSIADAIGTGITTALTTGTGENGQPQEIPIPTLNLKPESVIIQLGETEPTLEGSEESKDIPISEVTLKPTTILVNTDGATSSTEGETTPEVDVEGKIISYIDTGADTTALTAVKEIEGKIVSYLDNGADVTGLTIAKDIDGTITSYLDTGADITGLTKAVEIPGVIGSYTDPEASVSGLTVANAIKAIIALYEESPSVNNPSDYINDLTGEITSYSDSNEVTKPEKIEGIIGYIKQYENAKGADPNNLLNNLTGTATITTNTPDINITTTAADTTWGIWKEKVENDPLQIGIQPTPSQGEIPSPNPTPSPSSTPAPKATPSPTPTPAPTRAPSSNNSQTSNSINTSSITSAFDSAINSVVTKVGDISKEAEKISVDKVTAIQTEQNKIETTKIEAIKTAEESIESKNVKDIGTEESNISSSNIKDVKDYANTIDPAGAKAAQIAINAIPSSKNINIGATITVTANGGQLTKVTGDGIALNKSKRHIQIAKTGNVALAAGRDTLMGELGPEMVVSHGRYFVVGQNGPEMVNLAEDAIVFNHLQTEQLLRHGKASGHAKPVTNERKATSLATGNVGPAMASASAALAALKQLRAMWQSLLNASLKDLGGLAGGSGGGGGGGGGDDATKGVLGNIERWYNWLRDIEATQVKINKLTKEYTLLEKQGASSNARLKKLQDEYKQLQKNKETRESLAEEQTEYRATMLEQVQKGKGKYGLLSAFYDGNPEDGTFTLKSDEAFQKFVKKRGTGKTLKGNGIEVRKRSFYSEKEAEEKNKEIEKYNKDNEEAIKKGEKKAKKTVKAGDVKGSKKSNFKATSGIELFKKLQKTDQNGNLVYSSKDQLKILEDLGLGKYLEKDASGNKLKTAEEKVEYFFAQMESGPQEFDALTDSINDQEQAALDDAISMQEINEQIREMFTPVTGVTDSLEKWYNQLKKIEAINNKLNVLNKNNEILQRDQIANGEKIYNNYKDQIQQLEKKKAANEALKNQQIDERTNLVNQYKDLPISYNKKTGVATFSDEKYNQKIETSYTTVKTNDKGYAIDVNGNYVDKKGVLRNSKTGKEVKDKEYELPQTETVSKTYNAKGKTLPQIIEEITAQDEKGRVAYNAEQQYQIIKALGLEKFAKYDESGNKIYDRFGDLSQEEMESIVKAAISRIQKSADSINDATDSINNLTSENLDVDLELLDIQETFRQNTIEVENLMKDAVIQEHQDAIDQKNELKDAIDKAASKTVKGLRDSLDKERQTYDSDKDDKELTNLYMQLAAARAGGSAAQIDDLQQKIQDKRQDIYFNQREQAIDEIEESANKQIEALSEQTDIMQTALDYQVKYGEILKEVNKHLREWTTDQIGAYILKQDPNYLGKTQEEKNNFWKDLKQTIQQYTAKRDDDIKTEADNKQKAATVTSMIKKLPKTAGLADKKEVKAARKAYNSLTDDQKKLVKDKTLNRLTNAEAQVKTAEEKEAKRVAARNTTINGKLDNIAKKQPETLSNENFRNKVFNVGVNTYEKTKGTEEEKVAAAKTAMKQETNNIYAAAEASAKKITQEVADQIRQKYGDGIVNNLAKKYYSSRALSIYLQSGGNELLTKQQIFDAFNGEVGNEINIRANEAWEAFASGNNISIIEDKSILADLKRSFINTYNQKHGFYDGRKQAAENAALEVLFSKRIKRYATGGEIDYTGLAWVDGSKTKPEHIFNDQQMEFLKSGLYNNVNLTNSLVSSLGSILDKMANNDTYNSINNSDSVIIERAEVNLKIDEVASDYDARRIGQQAMNEMVRIARKSGNQSISRR